MGALLVASCVGAPPPPPGQGAGSSSTTAGSSSGDAPPPADTTTSGPSDPSTTGADSTSDGGSSSSGDPPEAKGECVHRCRTDEDCAIAGRLLGFNCVDTRCQPAEQCSSDGQCVAELSGWADGADCNFRAQCGGDQHCIGVMGSGHCVDSAEDGACTAGTEPVTIVNVNGDMVDVCGYPNAVCDAAGQCSLPCQSNDQCLDPNFPACNDGTGECGCVTDQPCEEGKFPGASACIDGVCGCTSSADCSNVGLGDVCSAGRCGCTDDTMCTMETVRFSGGTVVCQRP